METILLQKPVKQQKESEDLFAHILKGLEDARAGRIRRWNESDFQ